MYKCNGKKQIRNEQWQNSYHEKNESRTHSSQNCCVAHKLPAPQSVTTADNLNFGTSYNNQLSTRMKGKKEVTSGFAYR
jgi:hypothetical protein